MSRAASPRTLVGGVGYHDLRDYSVGPLLVSRLQAEREWPPGTEVEDLGYDPVKVCHRLTLEERSFQRLLVFGAARRGRPPGTVTAYRWDRGLPDPERIQARVAEAVTGVVDLDNLLVVTVAFEAAPDDVAVIEVEPEVEAVGDELSPAVEAGAERAAALVHRLVEDPDAWGRLPLAPLGAFGGGNGHGDADAQPPGAPRGRPVEADG